MTCIVGVSAQGGVVLGGDSCNGQPDQYVRYAVTGSKVFKLTDEEGVPLLVGYTTSWRMGDQLRYRLSVPPIPSNPSKLLSWIKVIFTDAVISAMSKSQWLRKKDERVEGGTFLIGVRGRIFQMGDDFSTIESSSGLSAVGCGYEFALGAMHARRFLRAQLPPQGRSRGGHGSRSCGSRSGSRVLGVRDAPVHD